MTVQELIDKLEKIEDKEQRVAVYSYDDYNFPSDVCDYKEIKDDWMFTDIKGVLII